MKTKTLNRLSLIIAISGLLAFIGAGRLYVESKKDTVLFALANAEDHPKTGYIAGGHENEGTCADAHGAEGSDLDRPVEALWAAKCEHNIMQYECDECRYEVGVVKLPSEMIDGGGDDGFIRTARTRRMQFSEERVLSGKVGVSEEKSAHVTSPFAGAIKAVYVGVGERVKAGAPLFDIDSHEVSEGKASYIKAIGTLDLAQKTSDRETRLFDKKISARMEVEAAGAKLAEAKVEVAQARARLVRLGLGPELVNYLEKGGADFSGLGTVRAPGGGIVMEKYAVAGEFAEVGKPMFRISDTSEVWAWANLKEADLMAIRKAGGVVNAAVDLPGGGKQRGRVDLVSNTMDEETRTVRARITLPNPNGELRPGMFVGIRLLMPGGTGGVAVPNASVLLDEGRSFVFIHKEKDFWIRRPVVTGRQLGGFTEILDGLTMDQTILTEGAFVAKSDVLRSKMGAGCAD
jgi:cobalt-zinc-cadmium efflux system membrane fusion protein